ncbi:MAG: 2-hydroxyacid dehydrogenase [Pseudomonadota bacterium]
MDILFAAAENAWGGFLAMVRARLPHHRFVATGGFAIDSLKGFHVLIPTMCQVTEEILSTSDRLKLIQQCGAGLEGVDLDAAARRRVWVANVPTATSGNADSVAELGIFLTIGLLRNWREMAGSFEHGRMGQPQGLALQGRTVGLIGLGGIGQAMIRRLKPFGVRLLGVRQQVTPGMDEALGLDWIGTRSDLPFLLRESDVVMLCLPVTPDSRNLMNRERFAMMKPGSLIVNLSRGGLVERMALHDALASGTIAGAGLDVFWQEPPDPRDPIFSFNVLATPHIAGSTDVSMQGIVAGVAENIQRLERGLSPLNRHD